MNEELKNKLTENFEQLVPTEFTNPTMYDSLLKVYLAGGEHGYKYAVEKACEWLEKYAANFVALPDEGQQPIGDTNAIYGTKSLLYYLRKEMEE